MPRPIDADEALNEINELKKSPWYNEGTRMRMEKNPAKCKHSMLFGDVYICKLQTIPCAALHQCAEEQVKNMANAIKRFIEEAEPPKEE